MLWLFLCICAGVPVHTPSGAMVARAIILNCSLDLPARAIVLNTKQWNGLHGCLYCEHEGVTLGGDHLHRYWPYQLSQLRTHASLLNNAEQAVSTGNAVVSCYNNIISRCSKVYSSSPESLCKLFIQVPHTFLMAYLSYGTYS